MKAPVKQHDWSALNEWFARRAKEAGHSVYEHSEDITEMLKPSLEDEEIFRRASEL